MDVILCLIPREVLMALINYATREINAKIVYYGPGLSGKTTNIQYVFNKVKPGNKGKLISLATQGDRTLFFDFLPVELGVIKGFKTRFHLYTVPGQVFYNSTRKMVLKGSDGVVFVADSQKMMRDENIQSLENLKENLGLMGLQFDQFPVVLQYNKRDLPNASTVDEINEYLNPAGLPYFEASAVTGEGVLKSLTAIVKFVLNDLKDMPGTQGLDMEQLARVAEAVREEEELAPVEPTVAVSLPAALDEPEPVPVTVQAPAPPVHTETDEPGEVMTFGTLVDEGAADMDILDAHIEVMEAEAVSDDGSDMELPEASPQIFGAFNDVMDVRDGDEVYEAVEVPEGELIERFSPSRLDTDYYAGVDEEVRAEHALPDVQPIALHAVHAKRVFNLPVRLTTPNGLIEVMLKLNVDVELAGQGMDSVTDVEVLPPMSEYEPRPDHARPPKDETMHPPPADGLGSQAGPQHARPPAVPGTERDTATKTVLENSFDR